MDSVIIKKEPMSDSDGHSRGRDRDEDDQPPKKKKRCPERLEHRLSSILCCSVCLDLPKTSIYQCSNGHLMCAGCFSHLLADARIREENASCPICRILIKKDLCSRNLAVEKALSEWPEECRYCGKEVPRSQLKGHEEDACQERLTSCCYSRIGCQWAGPYLIKADHERICNYPRKCGADIMEALEVLDKQKNDDKQKCLWMYDLLSLENIAVNDLQFKPYRTDEVLPKLYYETSRFIAFNCQWVVKACVNDNQKDPTQSSERTLSYQIILKSRNSSVIGVKYMLLKGPFGDMKLLPQVYHDEFSDADTEKGYRLLQLIDSTECNRLLAAKVINFRLIMFQVTR